MPGPHGFAVRKLRRRRRAVEPLMRPESPALRSSPRANAARVHRIPPRVRDDRDTPLVWEGTKRERIDVVGGSQGDWQRVGLENDPEIDRWANELAPLRAYENTLGCETLRGI
jgi:hypothetical protein